MILHTLNKASLKVLSYDCLSLLSPGDSLLLLEDGVYAALPDAPPLTLPEGVRLYVLAEDLAARGISDRIPPAFTRVDYAGFVALCLAHVKVINWS